ncbi:MAG: tRNA uridine-5-carboxymethylaminomethyl(34) synthesis enzyme MnmG, partial [Aestuariivirgaceae bacterium]
SEYRLMLRADNADERLTAIGHQGGVVGRERMAVFRAKMAAISEAREIVRAVSLTPSEGARHGLKLNQDGQRRSAFELLAYPEIEIGQLRAIWPHLAAIPDFALEKLQAEALYSGYVGRQTADIESYRREQALVLPDDLDYLAVPSLSAELQQKLSRLKPESLGQAARVEGMTPAAVSALLRFVKKPMPSRARASG